MVRRLVLIIILWISATWARGDFYESYYTIAATAYVQGVPIRNDTIEYYVCKHSRCLCKAITNSEGVLTMKMPIEGMCMSGMCEDKQCQGMTMKECYLYMSRLTNIDSIPFIYNGRTVKVANDALYLLRRLEETKIRPTGFVKTVRLAF